MKDLAKKTAPATPVTVERTHDWPVYLPDVDIIERNETFELYADVPGVDPNSITVNFEQGVLTIRAGRPSAAPNTDVIYSEFEPGEYERSFTVSDQIDAAKIAAQYRNGVLVLTLPKVEAAKPRKIEVKVS
ncbi:MAG: Hsp20/alpha crystallin family protein [bacterium]|nr:Hsp20/alpha crystallin family protein [bacterium]